LYRFFASLLVLCAAAFAQNAEPEPSALGGGPPVAVAPAQPQPEVPLAESSSLESSSRETKIEASPIIRTPDVKRPKLTFDWQAASNQSFFFLGIEHGIRMSQRKTRARLGGRFWEDYRDAVSGLGGWGDTDSIFTNYVAHPMQGAVTGFIQIQNDPGGLKQEFGRSADYWKSRTRAVAWSALYSTQFELGPISEASFGNVGKKRGTMGFVDLVMTPVGGMGLIVAEDAIDKKWVERLEARTDSLNRRRMYRMFMNPQRTFANLLRLKKPWHRDTRSINWGDMAAPGAPQPEPAAKPEPAAVSSPD
jgi:hypothetical protein